MNHFFEIEEGDRQAILLALAKLSLTRPGWHPACLSRIAEELGGLEMYEQFRSFGSDIPENFEAAIRVAMSMAANLAGRLDDEGQEENSRLASEIAPYIASAMLSMRYGPEKDRKALPTPANAIAAENGNIAVFDAAGNQIPALQKSWPALWAEHAVRHGVDPDGLVFELQGGKKFRLFRMPDGNFNREFL